MTSTKWAAYSWPELLAAVRQGVSGAARAAKRRTHAVHLRSEVLAMQLELENAVIVASSDSHALTKESIEAIRPTIDALAKGGAT